MGLEIRCIAEHLYLVPTTARYRDPDGNLVSLTRR
jgi:hypothetical protein